MLISTVNTQQAVLKAGKQAYKLGILWTLLILTLSLFATQSFAETYSLLTSTLPNRSGAVALANSELHGNVYIFLSPQTSVKRAEFYLDNPTATGTPRQTESLVPYDFAGTAANGDAMPFNTNGIGDGQHSITVRVTQTDNSVSTFTTQFFVSNATVALDFTPDSLSYFVATGSAAKTATVQLTTTNGSAAAFTLQSTASWLSASINSGTTPASITITTNPASLNPGTYSGSIQATGSGIDSVNLIVSLQVVNPNSATYSIRTSTLSNRSGSTALNNANLSGNAYIFTSPDTNVSRVDFHIDDPNGLAAPLKTESLPPFDLAGTDANGNAFPFDTNTLSDGSHVFSASIRLSNGTTQVIHSFANVRNHLPSLNFSTSLVDIAATLGASGTISRTVQISTSDNVPSSYTVSASTSWLHPTSSSGTTPGSVTFEVNPSSLAVGVHTATLTASAIDHADAVLTVRVTITSSSAALTIDKSNLSFTTTLGNDPAEQTFTIATNNGNPASYNLSSNVPWIELTPISGSTPQLIHVAIDTTSLITGNYTGTITATASGFGTLNLPVSLVINSDDHCAPAVCSQVLITLPYQLSFTGDEGHLVDSKGVGTGFTWLDKPSLSPGYLPSLITVDQLAGNLKLKTTAGLAYGSNNNQDNALGIGFKAPNQITIISTTLVNPAKGTGAFEQAGLWFGNDEDNYLKLAVMSGTTGMEIHHLMEVQGVTTAEKHILTGDLSNKTVTLTIKVNPFSRTAETSYQIGEGNTVKMGSLKPPEEFFSFDAAGIDPLIGTRSFAGIFASHRNGPTSLQYTFSDFSVLDGGTENNSSGSLDFVQTQYNIPFPTSMVWGPDNRLYVTELFGTIHALTFDAQQHVTNDQVINSLVNAIGPRLTLGITVGPNATAGNVDLWVSHSSPSVDAGEPNSSMVTRLSGTNFSTVNHIISGLPRAIANHAVNSLHFGADNRLYIAVGGNTGAGAPNSANTEFGLMAEQPLSAALLVADVFAPGFDGTCANTTDIFGPPPCDVVTYATGLRNAYDFVFHTNGHMYATDNGLGVTGTFPPKPTPPCFGLGSTNSYLSGGQNPGAQPDILHDIHQGAYYGHPNPTRNECVFKDGSYQGVSPLPNYEPAMFNLGDHKSSNAIVEYKTGVGCVGQQLNGQLLITNYSVGDDIVRVKLNSSGTGVTDSATLIGGFNDPLPMTTGPNGVIYLGEFGGQRVRALVPVSLGCWTVYANGPQAILDSAGATVGGKLYAIGGKNASGHINTLYIYNPITNTWSQGANMPTTAVENPATAVMSGKIYVFGGSTQPFSGAVTNASVYNPATNSWSTLAPMPTARGGATAQLVGTKIYVVGGMDNNGASVTKVEIYNPATNTWSTGPQLQTARDNPGSAVLGGNLYIFGGRTRLADGTVVNGTLNTVEMLNASSNSWSFKASMPTGRRTMTVGTLNGKAQVMGGEASGTGSGVFSQNEEYDPVTNTWRALVDMKTPRHGAAFATINDTIYVFGGGVVSGTSFTSALEAFIF